MTFRKGLNRIDAAAYIGVVPRTFDKAVRDGKMPKPRRLNGRVLWDLKELDVAFERLPRKDGNQASEQPAPAVSSMEAEPWGP